MAIGVVHGFEVIDISHHDRDRPPAHDRPLHVLVQLAHHVAPVVQAGQLVDHRQLQPLVHPAAKHLDITGPARLRAYADQQLLFVDRRQDHIACANLQPFGRTCPVVCIADQEDRNGPRRLSDLEVCAQLQGIKGFAGQREDQQVHTEAGQIAHRPGLCERDDGVPRLTQNSRKARRGAWVVIDDEDPGRLVGFIFGGLEVEPSSKAIRLPLPQFGRHGVITHQGADTRHQREIIDRFGQEVFRASLQAAHPVFRIAERSDHDDRNKGGLRILFQETANLIAIHPGHHHIQQDDIRQLSLGHFKRLRAIFSLDDRIVLGFELGLQQAAVGFNIVDYKDPRAHAASLGMSDSTALIKVMIWIGLERYPSQPASRTRCSSARMAKAVTARTGIWATFSSSLSQRVISRPETSGSWMSMMMRSGCSRRAISTALAPSRHW